MSPGPAGAGTVLCVRVQPGARRDALVGRLASGEWKLAVRVPPEGGRANEAVLSLLARLLDVRRSRLTLQRGQSSRGKRIEVSGIGPDDAESRLAAALAETEGRSGG